MVNQYKDWIVVAGAAGAVIAGIALLSRDAEAVDEPAIDNGEILLPDNGELLDNGEFPTDAFDSPPNGDDPIEVVPLKIVGRPEYSIGALERPFGRLEVIGPPGYSIGALERPFGRLEVIGPPGYSIGSTITPDEILGPDLPAGYGNYGMLGPYLPAGYGGPILGPEPLPGYGTYGVPDIDPNGYGTYGGPGGGMTW